MSIDSLKLRLSELQDSKVTLITRGRKQKIIKKTGHITVISDNLFCIDVPIGKSHVETKSFRYAELLNGVIELAELNIEEAN